jgi:cystathionine beta-synthase
MTVTPTPANGTVQVYNEGRCAKLIDDERRPSNGRRCGAPRHPRSVAPDARFQNNLMTTYNVSQLPVIEADDGIGAVSEQALMARAIGQPKILDSPVREVMDLPFPVVDSHSPVAQLTMLLSRTTPAALVRRDGKVVGIVTRYDLLHQLAGGGGIR